MTEKIVKIAYIIQTFHPHVGGTERQLLTLLPLLQDQGLETVVITRRLPGTTMKENVNGTMVYRCPQLPGKHLSSVSFSLFAIYYLFKLKPDCIHAFQLLSPLTIAVLYRKLQGVPIVCKVQRGGILGDVARIKAKIFTRFRLNLLANNVDAYQVISKEIFHELQSIGVAENRLKIIPNGVVLNHYAPVADMATKREIRTQLDLPHAGLVFVAVGRLVAVKKLNLLINAWHSLNRIDEELSTLSPLRKAEAPILLIVGEGPEKSNLIEAAGEAHRIKFLGKRNDVKQILQAADILIHASDSEGQSNAIQEGLATGLPIIASNVGAAEDQVKTGQNGWLFPPGNQQQLQQALRSAIEQADNLHLLGRNSRRLIEKKYDIKITACSLADVYRQLISGRKAL